MGAPAARRSNGAGSAIRGLVPRRFRPQSGSRYACACTRRCRVSPRSLADGEHPAGREGNLSDLRVRADARGMTEIFTAENCGCVVDEVEALGHEDPDMTAGHRPRQADVAHAENSSCEQFTDSHEAAGSPRPHGQPRARRVEDAQNRSLRRRQGPLKAGRVHGHPQRRRPRPLDVDPNVGDVGAGGAVIAGACGVETRAVHIDRPPALGVAVPDGSVRREVVLGKDAQC